MRARKLKNKIVIEISGEPIKSITDFFNRFSKISEPPKKIQNNKITIFEGVQYTDKHSLSSAIISSYRKKYPDLSSKFLSLAESKNMNKEIASQIKSISPLWFNTVMEFFNYGKSS